MARYLFKHMDTFKRVNFKLITNLDEVVMWYLIALLYNVG